MFYSRMRYRTIIMMLAWAFSTPVWAGGGPANVLVVVNQTSSNSVALGRHYAQQRGLHERQIFRIAITNERNIEATAFTNEIRNPVFDYLTASGLDEQIDYIVFSRDIPYRVFAGNFTNSRHASLTAAMFYDVFTSPNAFVSGCDLAAGSANETFAGETSFRRPDPPVNPRYRLAAMITASNQAQALDIIDRAVAADFTRPAAHVYFEHGEDFLRNGRWTQYEDAAFQLRFVEGGPVPILVDGYGDPTPRTNAIGLMTGMQAYPRFGITELVPGAFAEHLTSFGGFLFNSSEGEGWREPNQMKITSWIANGAIGSAGTVVEPCAYPQKFPDARLHLWYGRGFSLGEAYYQAVQHPYQGIFLGDPLTQPYAAPPDVTVAGLTSNQIVSGVVSVVITGRVAVITGGVDRIDLYLNDQFHETVHRRPPLAANVITTEIDGKIRSYTVQSGDSLADIAAGLAAAINANPPNIPVRAFAYGDRIGLRQKSIDGSGTGIAYRVSTTQGAASNLGVMAWTATEYLLDSTFHAFTTGKVFGVAQPGDVLRVSIKRLDGVIVTNEWIPSSPQNASNVMIHLRQAINGNPDLQGSAGALVDRGGFNPYDPTQAEWSFRARSPGGTGVNGSVTFFTTSTGLLFSGGGAFTVNTNVLGARGMIYLSAGAPEISSAFSLDTTEMPDGPHTLRIVVHRGDGPGTQGHANVPFYVQNHALTVAITNPASNGLLSIYEPLVFVEVGDTNGLVTNVTLFVEGKPALATNQPPFVFTVPVADYGQGPITLQALARNDLDQAALSEVIPVIISPNAATSTGVPHAWLFGYGITNDFEAAALADLDGDGVPTWKEYIMDTDPTESASVLRVSLNLTQDNHHLITWSSSTGRLYTLDYTYDLLASWLTFSGLVQVAGNGGQMIATNETAAFATNLFYRVLVERP